MTPSHPRPSPLGSPSPSSTHSGAGTPSLAGASPALQGALLAFRRGSSPQRPALSTNQAYTRSPSSPPPPPSQSKPKPKPKPKPSLPVAMERKLAEPPAGGSPSALLAAGIAAGSRDSSLARSDGRLSAQGTGRARDPSRDASPASDSASEYALKGRDGHVAASAQVPRSATGVATSLLSESKAGRTSKNTSFIAANLAASRSPSPAPRPLSRPISPARTGPPAPSALERTDTSSLKPTTSLISMFEDVRKVRTGDPVKVDSPKRGGAAAVDSGRPGAHAKDGVHGKNAVGLPSAADKTTITTTHTTKSTATEPTTATPKSKPSPNPKPHMTPANTALMAARGVAKISPATAARSLEATPPAGIALKPATTSTQRPPTPPKPRGGSSAKTLPGPAKDDNHRPSAPPRAQPNAPPSSHLGTPKDLASDEKALTPLARRDTMNTTSSHDTFVSASSIQSPSPSPPPSRSPSRAAQPVRRAFTSASPTRKPAPPPPRRGLAGAIPSHLPTAELSNAIVAGSLASARLTPSNTGDADRVLHHRPQPSPRMLQTLRSPEGAGSGTSSHHNNGGGGGRHPHHKQHNDSDSEREKRYRRNRLRPKKHTHHEGARKRWRDAITEPQRRRYEAVWASNRGMLADRLVDVHGARVIPSDEEASSYVVGPVVREIWARSRLPNDELEEVWDLVDREKKGALGRREFVVGMWLLDQRLKGRKIPSRVGDSVWDSACGVVMRRKK